jgi:thiosulfate/3-mercaptopyruvate sulfurtransferase
MVLVFVYGSLRRGGEFHGHLADARFVAEWTTPAAWEMWDLDGYPAITPGGDVAVTGELYEVTDERLALLDELEEVPSLYQRTEVETPHGTAFLYVVGEPPEQRTPIPSGDWSVVRLPLVISPGDLHGRLDDVVVLDASWSWDGVAPREGHAKARIPGARLFDHATVRDAESGLHDTAPSAARFAAHMSALGVRRDDPIVLYSQGAFSGAARAWFLLRLFGHRAVSLLDGGLKAWEAAGYRVDDHAPSLVERAEYEAAEDPDWLVDVEGMRRALREGVQTVDARPADVYRGERDFFAGRSSPAAGKPGRIADMPNIGTSALVDERGNLKTPAELRAIFEGLGLDLSAPVVTTCSLGVGAAGVAFALRVSGVEQVAVFDGSYEAWAAT